MTSKRVRKSINTTPSNDILKHPLEQGIIAGRRQGRGMQVYSLASLIAQTGRDKEGRLVSWGFEQPLFYLTVQQRIEIAKMCSPVLGVVSSRMNRISNIPWNITEQKKTEDRDYQRLVELKDIHEEYGGTTQIERLIVRAKVSTEIRKVLPDVFPDLSNFNRAVMRWRNKIKNTYADKCQEAQDWLLQPNAGTSWADYVKKWVFDLLVHGAAATYKKKENNILTNFDVLPGGTVYKFKAPYFSGLNAYVQVVYGWEPQVFYEDEISYAQYLPMSGQNYSMIPLESLINKVSEFLLFDHLMAGEADGTKPPQKLVIVTNNLNPMGDFDAPQEVPFDKSEQKRIETKLNEPKKSAIITMTGNDAHLIDLTKENTMGLMTQRQKDIREEVALVFNMSNSEINLTGSEGTSGRATSETQQEIEQGKGIGPILRLLEEKITREILPLRFGSGYQMEFSKSRDEEKELRLDQLKQQTGEETVNEMRERKNLRLFDGEQFDKPQGAQPVQPGANNMNPLFTRPI